MIKTYNDLLEEKKRLKNLLDIQKQRVNDDWTLLKHELEPVNSAFGVIGRMTKGNKTNPLINMGLRLASDTILKNFVLAKTGWLTKLAVPLLVKNYSSHVVVEKGKSFLEKLKHADWGKLFKKKRQASTKPEGDFAT